MTSLKLTTGPGNPCSGIGMEANGSTAVAEMRSTTEATNGLALDGLTVFGSVMRVNRPKDYTGPDTDPPERDPNLLHGEQRREGVQRGGACGAAVAGDVPRAGAGEGRERAVGGDDVERS